MRILASIAAAVLRQVLPTEPARSLQNFQTRPRRYETFSLTRFLYRASEPCDFVVRTTFQGTALGADEGTIGGNDRHDYSISLPFHADGPARILSCKELAFFDRLLSRGKSKAKPCWEKY